MFRLKFQNNIFDRISNITTPADNLQTLHKQSNSRWTRENNELQNLTLCSKLPPSPSTHKYVNARGGAIARGLHRSRKAT